MKTPADHATTFWRSAPGQRFQGRYWRHRGNGRHRPMLARVAYLTLGTLLGVLGLAMLILPGPGIVALAMAGALFASESLPIARMLDWIELRGRAAWHRIRRKSPPRSSRL
jgi:hypothetical protein